MKKKIDRYSSWGLDACYAFWNRYKNLEMLNNSLLLTWITNDSTISTLERFSVISLQDYTPSHISRILNIIDWGFPVTNSVESLLLNMKNDF